SYQFKIVHTRDIGVENCYLFSDDRNAGNSPSGIEYQVFQLNLTFLNAVSPQRLSVELTGHDIILAANLSVGKKDFVKQGGGVISHFPVSLVKVTAHWLFQHIHRPTAMAIHLLRLALKSCLNTASARSGKYLDIIFG